MINKQYKIFISATEQSGDNIGSNVILEILKTNSNIIFDGLGGEKMTPLLNKQFYNLKKFPSMGIMEVIFSIKKYINMINHLVNKLIKSNYDLLITIDSPDFNYPLAKKLKEKSNIKMLHIVAPSVWAWRAYRAKNFSKVFDELFVLYDFEVKYFTRYGLKTTFIGHPIYYINKVVNEKNDKKNIAFLPGSRLSEIDSLFPYFQIGYKYLLTNHSKINIFIPTVPHLKDKIYNYIKNWKLNVLLTSDLNEIENMFNNTTHALVCSGTASLEIAKRNIPQLVIYKLNLFTELLARLFIKIKFANILNIIDNQMIIPEITNSNLNKKIFLIKFIDLLNSSEKNKKQIQNVNRILDTIYSDQPPYFLVSQRIMTYLS